MSRLEIISKIDINKILVDREIKAMLFNDGRDFLKDAASQSKITKLDNERAELERLLIFLKEN